MSTPTQETSRKYVNALAEFIKLVGPQKAAELLAQAAEEVSYEEHRPAIDRQRLWTMADKLYAVARSVRGAWMG